jgi:hypothetical protein
MPERSARRSPSGIEDAAVDHAVSLQEETGLTVVTDGEMRRLSFQSARRAVHGWGARAIRRCEVFYDDHIRRWLPDSGHAAMGRG